MVDALPEECLSQVISFTTPGDACRSSAVSWNFRVAADSDLAWEKFLPSDYRDIISNSAVPLDFHSNKELFRKLSSAPLLIDGGKKAFWLDKYTNKKCYMLSATELLITWSSNSLCWCWKPLLHSRFPEVVELIMVCWLQVRGKMNTRMLSRNTTYGAYLVIQVANRAFGLGTIPSEVSIEAGDYKTRGKICLNVNGSETLYQEGVCARGDGWLEVELGVFYNDGSEKQVNMEFAEIKGEHLKGGLIIEGIELRPKY